MLRLCDADMVERPATDALSGGVLKARPLNTATPGWSACIRRLGYRVPMISVPGGALLAICLALDHG